MAMLNNQMVSIIIMKKHYLLFDDIPSLHFC